MGQSAAVCGARHECIVEPILPDCALGNLGRSGCAVAVAGEANTKVPARLSNEYLPMHTACPMAVARLSRRDAAGRPGQCLLMTCWQGFGAVGGIGATESAL